MPRTTPKRKASINSANKQQAAKQPKCSEVTKSQQQKWEPAGGNIKPDLPHIFLLHSSKGQPPSDKCAAFDIDWCLIKPKSGGKWPKNAQDWCWLFSCIPDQLRKLNRDGYRLLFVSNQAGFEKGNVKPKEIMDKCDQIIRELGVTVDVLLISGQSHYRKPATAAWDLYIDQCNGGVKLNMNESIYVGDAAGRGSNKNRPKDFSCSDRMFASNIGIKFQTPEEFFHNEPAESFDWGCNEPKKLLEHSIAKTSIQHHRDNQELVIMIGQPASGKSTFAENYLVSRGYTRINRDLLKTQAKCLKALESALAEKKSVVVDNTNPTAQGRSDYIALGRKHKVPIRAIVMETAPAVAQHLNYFRQAQTEGAVRRIPMVAYRMFNSKFQQPDISEGFNEIVKAKFEFNPEWLSEKERHLIMKWTAAGH